MAGIGKTNWVRMPDGSYKPHIRFRKGLLLLDDEVVGLHEEFRKPFWEGLKPCPVRPEGLTITEWVDMPAYQAYIAECRQCQAAETEALKLAGYTVRIGWVLQPC